jgi:hypothetical protein
MKRLILAASGAALLTFPAMATPYRDFTDFKRRATVGETVIRAFPNTRRPTFKLILERRSSETCIVWLEFASRARPIDHHGEYGATVGERRELVEGPLFDDSTPDQHGDNVAKSFLADLQWVARGTSDALRLLRADVDLDDDGACVAGTQVQFTPNLAYRDVVDRKRLTTYGEARLRGFPSADPTFTLFVEFAEAGTEVEVYTGSSVVLPADACILWLEFGDRAFPFYSPSAFNETSVENRIDLLAHVAGGLGEGQVGALGVSTDDGIPWIARDTGEEFRIVQARVSLTSLSPGPGHECEGTAQVQYALRIEDFYR